MHGRGGMGERGEREGERGRRERGRRSPSSDWCIMTETVYNMSYAFMYVAYLVI